MWNYSCVQAWSHLKELHEKYTTDYGKKAAVGLPELIFIGKEFHGNRELAREAEAAGQLKRWISSDGTPWLGYNKSEVGRIEGTQCKHHPHQQTSNLNMCG